MGRYRKIDTRIWNDDCFVSLSDQAKLIFLFLLTHPHMTSLGAMRATAEGLASELGWDLGDFSKGLAELFRKPFLKADFQHAFLWVLNFLKYNPPENPNVVKSWKNIADELPECDLQRECFKSIYARIAHMGLAFTEALPEPFRKGMPNPEPEPEPDLKEDPIIPKREFSGLGLKPLIETTDDIPCFYCGATQKQTGKGFEVDHFIPRSALSAPVPGNRVLVCHVCNQAKSDRIFETIEAARHWLHNAYWTSNRERWVNHRRFAFGGNPPEGFNRDKFNYDPEFEKLWQQYPNHNGKGAGFQAWKKARKNGMPETEKLLLVIEKARKSKQWVKDNGQFIPMLSTFLNQHRWDDDYEPSQKARGVVC